MYRETVQTDAHTFSCPHWEVKLRVIILLIKSLAKQIVTDTPRNTSRIGLTGRRSGMTALSGPVRVGWWLADSGQLNIWGLSESETITHSQTHTHTHAQTQTESAPPYRYALNTVTICYNTVKNVLWFLAHNEKLLCLSYLKMCVCVLLFNYWWYYYTQLCIICICITHTHVWLLSLWDLSIGVMVFLLYKLYFLSPYTNPTPKPTPHRKLYAFLDFQKT